MALKSQEAARRSIRGEPPLGEGRDYLRYHPSYSPGCSRGMEMEVISSSDSNSFSATRMV